jgi:hypothetical protein
VLCLLLPSCKTLPITAGSSCYFNRWCSWNSKFLCLWTAKKLVFPWLLSLIVHEINLVPAYSSIVQIELLFISHQLHNNFMEMVLQILEVWRNNISLFLMPKVNRTFPMSHLCLCSFSLWASLNVSVFWTFWRFCGSWFFAFWTHSLWEPGPFLELDGTTSASFGVSIGPYVFQFTFIYKRRAFSKSKTYCRVLSSFNRIFSNPPSLLWQFKNIFVSNILVRKRF